MQKHSSSLDDDEVREELEQIKNDIDFLYNLVQPEAEIVSMDNLDYGVKMQITEEIYNELLKYSENKTHLFMGIA